ncbi:MAG: hypothetical protein LBD14_06450, partial [Puniceicoccales bacterium]|nr:hypothetical protein [Puniceicoccales bacterium]
MPRLNSMPAFPRNPFAPGGERFTIPHAFVLPGLNGQVWLSPKWQDILPPTIEFDPKRAIPPMPRQREKRGVETTRAPAQGVRDSGA